MLLSRPSSTVNLSTASLGACGHSIVAAGLPGIILVIIKTIVATIRSMGQL